MERIRWGVVGAGGIADRRVLPVFAQASNCSLSVVMDIRNADKLGAKYGVSATDRLEEVLARDDVDAVYVATPVYLHCEQVIAAARAGKHVLCEKPLARTVAEGRAMLEACQEAGVLLREAFMLRFHGAHREIARLLAEGAIGKPVSVTVHWSFFYPKTEGAWRQVPELGGGGSLADIGVHVFDLLQMLLGPVARVAACTGTLVQDYPVEDVGSVLLVFSSGVQAVVTASFCSPGAARFEIYGSLGFIRAVDTMGQEPGGSATIYRQGQAGEASIPYQPVNTYLRQLEDFSESVARGEAVREGQEHEILSTLTVLEATYQSARSGQFVAI